MKTKIELQSQIEFLKSTIIRLEYSAEHMNQELEDLHRRLEDSEIDLATMEGETSGC